MEIMKHDGFIIRNYKKEILLIKFMVSSNSSGREPTTPKTRTEDKPSDDSDKKATKAESRTKKAESKKNVSFSRGTEQLEVRFKKRNVC